MPGGIRPAPSTLCPRKLRPGQVRRVPARGRLVGFHIACPGCAFVASYLAEEGGFVEEFDAEGSPLLVGVARPPPCLRCRKRIDIVDEELVAR